jgi:hypothetical protein
MDKIKAVLIQCNMKIGELFYSSATVIGADFLSGGNE